MHEIVDLEKKTMLFCVLSVIIFPILAQQDESVSINKPRTRMQQPWVQINTDHVRCFCNLPVCVGTGYMCKSSGGGCFSDLLESRSSAYRGRHGCVEFLSGSQRSRCTINDGHIQRPKDHPKSLLVCCNNDLCNHVDSPNTRTLINNTLGVDDSDSRYPQQSSENFLYSNSEVWFRAATIAVPICGAVILFALIALAVKILKSENQSAINHKLGTAMYVVPSNQKHGQEKWSDQNYKQWRPYYPHAHPNSVYVKQDDDSHGQFQVPLLVSNEVRNLSAESTSNCASASESKNDTNAKLNFKQCDSNSSKSIILEIEKGLSNYSKANINLNIDNKFSNSEKSFIS